MNATTTPPTKQEKLANLRRIFDLADAEAEKFERRDALRVQAFIESLRQGVPEQEHILKLIETYKDAEDGHAHRLD
jgi:hypothetical protein